LPDCHCCAHESSGGVDGNDGDDDDAGVGYGDKKGGDGGGWMGSYGAGFDDIPKSMYPNDKTSLSKQTTRIRGFDAH
jgi:hypothetical protein